mmetsp:Transcript_77887/g.252499  ORF Transcript_77887/g.252499 Transcript_77887/m.252499 type:complete len:290 (-) Transcript_77887:140-1009(-)
MQSMRSPACQILEDRSHVDGEEEGDHARRTSRRLLCLSKDELMDLRSSSDSFDSECKTRASSTESNRRSSRRLACRSTDTLKDFLSTSQDFDFEIEDLAETISTGRQDRLSRLPRSSSESPVSVDCINFYGQLSDDEDAEPPRRSSRRLHCLSKEVLKEHGCSSESFDFGCETRASSSESTSRSSRRLACRSTDTLQCSVISSQDFDFETEDLAESLSTRRQDRLSCLTRRALVGQVSIESFREEEEEEDLVAGSVLRRRQDRQACLSARTLAVVASRVSSSLEGRTLR